MTVKEHYDRHLGNFYSLMTGDFETMQHIFHGFLEDHSISPSSTKNAIELGAGHGLQSIPLAKIGFHVTAVDFNRQLLGELETNAGKLKIEIRNDDIRNVKQYADREPELITCCGDTLSHLENKREVQILIEDIAATLQTGGKAILSFRDYSTALTSDHRFIPVKSDETKILTCFLDYNAETVRVTDLLHVKTDTGWNLKVSSYDKVRITTEEIKGYIQAAGMRLQVNQARKGMTYMIAAKP